MREREFCILYEEQYRRVYGYVCSRLDDEESARDVTAETFLVAWRTLRAPPEHPTAWLLAVARRHLANYRRGVGRRARLAQKAATAGDHDVADGPEDIVSRREEVEEVQSALAQLSKADREVIYLAVWEELGSHELGKVLGCTAGTARVRLHRARHRLERLLHDPLTMVPQQAPPGGDSSGKPLPETSGSASRWARRTHATGHGG